MDNDGLPQLPSLVIEILEGNRLLLRNCGRGQGHHPEEAEHAGYDVVQSRYQVDSFVIRSSILPCETRKDSLPLPRGEEMMAKRSVTAQVEEKQLRRASRYLKTRHPSETLKAALDFVAEKSAHEQVVRKYSGVGQPDAFQDS